MAVSRWSCLLKLLRSALAITGIVTRILGHVIKTLFVLSIVVVNGAVTVTLVSSRSYECNQFYYFIKQLGISLTKCSAVSFQVCIIYRLTTDPAFSERAAARAWMWWSSWPIINCRRRVRTPSVARVSLRPSSTILYCLRCTLGAACARL